MCNILLVEDHQETREALALSLKSYGHTVQDAPDGAEALRLLSELGDARPCIILMDMRMPHLDGWDLLRTLQDYPPWAHIPVIVVSAMIRPSVPNPVLRAKAFWSKPPDSERLAMLQTYCEKHRAVDGPSS